MNTEQDKKFDEVFEGINLDYIEKHIIKSILQSNLSRLVQFIILRKLLNLSVDKTEDILTIYLDKYYL